jgi:carbon storage regulator
VINGDILITVLEVGRNGQVRLGIDAPRHYQVYRRELWLEIEQENKLALASARDPKATSAVPTVANNVAPKVDIIAEPTPTGQHPVKH